MPLGPRILAGGDWLAGNIEGAGYWGANAIDSRTEMAMAGMQPGAPVNIGSGHMGFASGLHGATGGVRNASDTIYGYYDDAIGLAARPFGSGGPREGPPGVFRSGFGAYANVAESFDGAVHNVWESARDGGVAMAGHRWGPDAAEVAGYYGDSVGNVGHAGRRAWNMYGVRPFARRVGKQAFHNRFGSGGGYGGPRGFSM
eukprot:NODE_459_length_820_cov_405.770563_g450_i0.p1 GENE.NODE_459_length_820_cov_405.770563_g450_i0~~NODE_459_length_820_cov_405.770563_g450_i0.p1  ORF type:complete len:200 (+),score=42.99 NODE_459_length_820_cov_405.770563_g450_i0:58-657(+)